MPGRYDLEKGVLNLFAQKGKHDQMDRELGERRRAEAGQTLQFLDQQKAQEQQSARAERGLDLQEQGLNLRRTEAALNILSPRGNQRESVEEAAEREKRTSAARVKGRVEAITGMTDRERELVDRYDRGDRLSYDEQVELARARAKIITAEKNKRGQLSAEQEFSFNLGDISTKASGENLMKDQELEFVMPGGQTGRAHFRENQEDYKRLLSMQVPLTDWQVIERVDPGTLWNSGTGQKFLRNRATGELIPYTLEGVRKALSMQTNTER